MVPLGKVLICSFIVKIGILDGTIINNKTFPADFSFGVATSAYQIEGGWNADGKSQSVWDNQTHEHPGMTADVSNADVACDSYHKYKEDVVMLKSLGVNVYQFSIAWTRILPNGIADNINKPGVSYYQNLITELKDNNIEPLVSLLHYDIPQALQNLGGPMNASFVDWFAEYARIAFQLFGDDVKNWITINDANMLCSLAWLPPPYLQPGIGEYVCGRNLLLAHAAVWHVYNDNFRERQAGKVSISLGGIHHEPASNNTADSKAAETAYEFEIGWMASPLYFGDYPEIMRTRIGNRSKDQGYNISRLPEFTDEEKTFIKGSVDFFAVNFYTTYVTLAIPEYDIYVTSRAADIGVDDFPIADIDDPVWLKVMFRGMRKLLYWVKDHYGSPEIKMTWNGYSDIGHTLEDEDRIYYIQNYLSNTRDAMEKEAVNVTTYLVWSLMDNFAWTMGYSQKFGLYHVDFNDPSRTRTPKKSASYYQQVIRTHCLVDECVP